MVDLTITSGNLVMNVLGADKLWAFKSSMEIPLQHVAGIRADPEIARSGWKGWRIPGTSIPGVITAGTYYKDGKRVFWDVHGGANAVVIDLREERYNQLVVEVADPNAAVGLLKGAIRS